MKLCLVTGGAGFIGGHIVRRLLEQGCAVRVLDDFSSGRSENLTDLSGRIDVLRGDIRNRTFADQAVRGVDTVFHLAALGSVPRSVADPAATHDVNTTGTLTMLLAAREAQVRRFVNSSSSSVYGDTPTLPKVESMTPRPQSPYAVSKLAAEQYCAAFAHVYGMQTLSLRYFNVFGPRQDPTSQYAAVIPAFMSCLLRGKPPTIYGDGEQSRDFCYVDNVVDANLAAGRAAEARGQALNIACNQRTTLNEILQQLNGALGTNIRAQYAPPRAGDVKHSLADITAARELIDYRPTVMFAEGLERSLEWYRRHLS